MSNKRQRIEDLGTKQLPYSQCSKSQQSRRRAHLMSTIQELSGVSDSSERFEAECVALLRDTISKNSQLASFQDDDMSSNGLLQQLVQNIKDRHDSLPDEKRTETLALVANVFSRKDLKDKYKFYFGNRQIQSAKQMAIDRQFVVEPDEHVTPRIRLPKTAQFVDKIEEFLNNNSAPSSSMAGSASGNRVLTKALRVLHREFIQSDSANRISFSTFRAIALEKFTLPGQKNPEASLPSTEVVSTTPAAPALNFRPIRPLLSASSSAASSSSRGGGMTLDAIVNQPATNPIVSTSSANGFTSQPLSSILQLPLPSSTQSSMPMFGQTTNNLVSENPQQILNAINLSMFGVNSPASTSQVQQQQQQQQQLPPGNNNSNMLSSLILPSLDFTASRDNMYNSNPFQTIQPLTSYPNVNSQQTMDMFDSQDPFLTNNSASMLLENVDNSQMAEIPNINNLFSLMESLGGGTQEEGNTVNNNNQPSSSSQQQQLPSDFFSFE